MAKFRRRRKWRGQLPFRYVLLLSFVFFLFSTATGLWLVNKGIEPILMGYAESQTRKIASLVINKAISKKAVDFGDVNNVIEITPGPNGSAPSANLKTEIVNRKLSEITSQIQKNLTAAEKGDLSSLEHVTDVEIETNVTKHSDGIVWYVPIGQATNIALFGNLGPKIPVKFNAIGDVRPDVKIDPKPIGINNTWIDVSIHLEVSVRIITPFATKITKLDQSIFVGGTLVQGVVPQYYNGGNSSPPSLQLPKDKSGN
ncbi:sporulation protein YunB [Neobacillus sp.]|uniref:sporulation protein YunB n=1 Tax=Neobacillus sp. TaxID=2675273 RepID=UPI0028A2204A|nr:sporulation protein YunB [Neobacillus sp.]